MRAWGVLACSIASLFPAPAARSTKIVVLQMSPGDVAEIREANPDVNLVAPLTKKAPDVTAVTADRAESSEQEAALMRDLADADAIIGGPTREMLQAAKKVRWVQILSAGVDEYRYPELLDGRIMVTNGRGIASPGIADHAVGMLLGLTRRLAYFAEIRTREKWERRPYGLLELKDKTALIIGVGNIGSQIARRVHAFDMNVIGVDPREMPPSPFVRRMVYPDRLDEVLPLADAVFVSAPLTPESEGMMGERQFRLMKKGSCFIAISRGGLYRMEALVHALESKRLAGAGVDVATPEPLPPGHPLWKFNNVIITPHMATETDGERPRRLELIKDNVRRFSRGEMLRNRVDMHRGY